MTASTYFFDVTDTVVYLRRNASISGIQRVSFEIIKRMIHRYGPESVKLSYWEQKKREYVAIPSFFLESMDEFDAETLRKVFLGRNFTQPFKLPTLESYQGKPIKYWFNLATRIYNAQRGNEAHFAKRNSSIEEWRKARRRASAFTKQAETHFMKPTALADMAKPGDHLVLLGTMWGIYGVDERLQTLKDQCKLRIYLLVHDLIPAIAPEYTDDSSPFKFYNWLTSCAGYCDGFIANSKNTAKDLSGFLAEIGVQRPIWTVPLAQDIMLTDQKRTRAIKGPKGDYKARMERTLNVRHEILNLSRIPFVLAVGTMESRKNVWRLAQVWQRLSTETGFEVPRLVFAGKPGWYIDDFNDLMRSTGNLGGWVQFVERPTDSELAYLYETCVFTAMVSLYEGWGLPVGESLAFGKTAVVSNNSSLPEVGGDMVEYCDAHSIESIYAACRKLIEHPTHRPKLEDKIATATRRTWEDVATDFVNLLNEDSPYQENPEDNKCPDTRQLAQS